MDETLKIATLNENTFKENIFQTFSVFKVRLRTSIRDTVEPRFNEPLYNEVLGITNDILQPGLLMYGTEPRYNEPISLVSWHFVKSRFHSICVRWLSENPSSSYFALLYEFLHSRQ